MITATVNSGGPQWLMLWDIRPETPKLIVQTAKNLPNFPAISPDARTLAVPQHDGTVDLLDLSATPPKVTLAYKATTRQAPPRFPRTVRRWRPAGGSQVKTPRTTS